MRLDRRKVMFQSTLLTPEIIKDTSLRLSILKGQSFVPHGGLYRGVPLYSREVDTRTHTYVHPY